MFTSPTPSKDSYDSKGTEPSFMTSEESFAGPPPFEDNRPEAVAQRKLQSAINGSAHVQQLKSLHAAVNGARTVLQRMPPKTGSISEETPKTVQPEEGFTKGKIKETTSLFDGPISTQSGRKIPAKTLLKDREIFIAEKHLLLGNKPMGLKPQYGIKLEKDDSETYYALAEDIEETQNLELKSFDDSPLFIDDTPKASDIKQGNLGDCFLLAAAGTVAHQHPGKIKDMFSENQDQTVDVRFFKKKALKDKNDYQPEQIKVDKKLYVSGTGKQPEYAQVKKALWPAILEKAYAWFRGKLGAGYKAIHNGGMPSEVYEHLLGKDAEEYEVSGMEKKTAFKRIQKALKNGQAVSVGTKAEFKPQNGKGKGTGLKAKHAYMVLDVKNPPLGHRQVLLRNPHDKNGRAYRFGKAQKTRNGEFWMKAGDLLQFFDKMYISGQERPLEE